MLLPLSLSLNLSFPLSLIYFDSRFFVLFLTCTQHFTDLPHHAAQTKHEHNNISFLPPSLFHFFYCKLFNFRFLFALFVCFLTCILLIPLWALPALSISSALSTCKSNEMYKILTALQLHVDKFLGPSLRTVGACCNSSLTVECLVRCSLIRVDDFGFI